MRVTELEVTVHHREPIRDALQSLPGSGSVRVTVRTGEGISGSGEVGLGRNGGDA